MRTGPCILALVISALALCSCASRGPVVPVPPTVEVSQLDSVVITPDLIKFRAKVFIRNRMRARMSLDHMDYAVDLHDRELFESSFEDLLTMKSRGKQTVTVPFQISMKDVLEQAVDVLAEEGLRVDFRGWVYPLPDSGFEPIPFAATRVIPFPRIPEVFLAGVTGAPFSEGFEIVLRMHNPNRFPLTLKAMKTWMVLNGKRYPLFHTGERTHIGPDSSELLYLGIHHSKGKALSMLLNMAQSGSREFSLGGSVEFGTPHGLVYLPVELTGGFNTD